MIKLFFNAVPVILLLWPSDLVFTRTLFKYSDQYLIHSSNGKLLFGAILTREVNAVIFVRKRDSR